MKDTFLSCDLKANSTCDNSLLQPEGTPNYLIALIMGTDNFLAFDTSVTMGLGTYGYSLFQATVCSLRCIPTFVWHLRTLSSLVGVVQSGGGAAKG